MIRRIFYIVFVCILISISACSIAFSTDTEEFTVKIPNTYGVYIEAAIEIPEDARDEKIEYSDVIIHYEVSKGGFATDIAMYISADSLVDNVKNDNDEELIDLHLGISDDTVSGEAESELLKEQLHNEYIVIGIENLSAGSPFDYTEITIYITVKGQYSIF